MSLVIDLIGQFNCHVIGCKFSRRVLSKRAFTLEELLSKRSINSRRAISTSRQPSEGGIHRRDGI